MERTGHLRAAAVLLVAGWFVFWGGALTPLVAGFELRRWYLPIPAIEFLSLVAANEGIWLWVAASFAAGVLLTLAGLVVLGAPLRAAGDRVWCELGQAAFLFGSVLWLASIAFRATATISAATQAASAGEVPSWYEPMRDWAGLIFAVYMVLAYLAIAGYGAALLRTRLAPRWIARTHLYFGLLGAVGYVARVPVFDPPLMIHLVPGLLGIVLLVRPRGSAASA